MEKILYLNINEKDISKDDLLLAFSDVNANNNKTYRDIVEFQLRNFYKNNDSIEKNLLRLQEQINDFKNIEIFQLDRSSPKINGPKENGFWIGKKEVKNLVFVFTIEDETYNKVAFFTDASYKKKTQNYQEQQNLLFDINRIEFLKIEDNRDKSEINDLKIILNCDRRKEKTDISILHLLKEHLEPVFDNDDNDELLMDQWFDFLKLIRAVFKQDEESSELNQIIIFDNNKYLLSKSEFEFNNKASEYILNISSTNISDLEIGKIDKYEKINFPRIIENKIDQLNNDQKNKNQEKERLWEEKHSLKKQSEKMQQNLNEQSEKKKEDLSEKEKKVKDRKNKELKINELKLQIKSIENKIAQLNKNQKNNNLLVEQKKFVRLKNQLIEENENISKEITDLEQKIKNWDEKIKQTDKEKKDIDDQIEVKRKEIALNKKNRNDLESMLNNSQSLQNFIKENSYKYFYKFDNLIFKEKDIEFNLDENIEDALKSIDWNNPVSITTKSIAKSVKIKRLTIAYYQLNNGYYKNYRLYSAIKNPSTIFKFKNNIPINVKLKYKLNKKQEEAVKKAININDIFYLQGPPGTGKTQTLCAISECILAKKENLVMCSSTHEAIDNFLERLRNFNKTDPNLIIFKYRFSNSNDKKKDSLYAQEKLFFNFKEAIYENVLNKQNDTFLIREKYQNYSAKYGNEIPKNFFKKGLPKSFVNVILKNIDYINKNKELLNLLKNFNDNNDFIWPFNDVLYNNNDNNSISMDEEEKKDILKKQNRWYIWYKSNNEKEHQKLEAFDELVNAYSFTEKDLVYLNQNKIMKFLQDKTQLNNQSKLERNIKAIRNYFKNSENKDHLETKFLNYIFEKNLINVIGITTTSRQTIKINDQTKNLFSDYPIDTILIDEISKSPTPEIVSKSILAKKIILSGDYLQLPPNCEFNDDYDVSKIIDFLNKLKTYQGKDKEKQKLIEKNRFVQEWTELIKSEDEKDLKYAKEKIKEKINKLFKTSFFVIQIQKIKKNKIDSKEKSFEYLNESRRFSGQILKIVNKIYPKEEQLKSVIPIEKVPKYNLEINQKKLDKELVMIDTSEPDFDYFAKHHSIDKDVYNYFCQTFDQRGEAFKLIKKQSIQGIPGDSLYNQYSALVTVNIIKNLLDKNSDKINENRKIAIITLTKSQKNVIRHYVKIFIDSKRLSFIKIDTIDNFQGREEEIVIVDFIRGAGNFKDAKINQGVKSKNRDLSFLKEFERINVAISRPKSKLILIGAFKSYLADIYIKEKGQLFNDYLEECQSDESSYLELKEADPSWY